jgi:hypothetical protein
MPLTGTPVDKSQAKQHHQAQTKFEARTASNLAAKLSGSSRQFTIEPNKRYLSVRLVHLKAFVDYVNPKEDEFIYATVSFLR